MATSGGDEFRRSTWAINYARLALEEAGLGKQLVVEATMAWVCAWWDVLMPRENMRSAWRYAFASVGMAQRLNAEVRGWAGASFARFNESTAPLPRQKLYAHVQAKCYTSETGC